MQSKQRPASEVENNMLPFLREFFGSPRPLSFLDHASRFRTDCLPAAAMACFWPASEVAIPGAQQRQQRRGEYMMLVLDRQWWPNTTSADTLATAAEPHKDGCKVPRRSLLRIRSDRPTPLVVFQARCHHPHASKFRSFELLRLRGRSAHEDSSVTPKAASAGRQSRLNQP